jgi:beta-lactamase regulating signal transducer with metallopeptidase domain
LTGTTPIITRLWHDLSAANRPCPSSAPLHDDLDLLTSQKYAPYPNRPLPSNTGSVRPRTGAVAKIAGPAIQFQPASQETRSVIPVPDSPVASLTSAPATAATNAPAASGQETSGTSTLQLAPATMPLARQSTLEFGLCGWWPGLAWFVGIAICIGRLIGSRIVIALVDRSGQPVTDRDICMAVRELASQLAIRRPVRLRKNRRIAVPVAFGILRPTVIIPVALDEQFTPVQQRAILAHELAHLAARDPWWLLLGDLACALLWWHPLLWWSQRQLRDASEMSADEASRLVPAGGTALASSLVATGRQLATKEGLSGTKRLGWITLVGFRSGLARRVDRLINRPPRKWRAPSRRNHAVARYLLTPLLIGSLVLGSTWLRPKRTIAQGETTMNMLKQSWNGSIAAAALSAILVAGPAQAQDDETAPTSAQKNKAQASSQDRLAPRDGQPDRFQGPVDVLNDERQKIDEHLHDERQKIEEHLHAKRRKIEEHLEKIDQNLGEISAEDGTETAMRRKALSSEREALTRLLHSLKRPLRGLGNRADRLDRPQEELFEQDVQQQLQVLEQLQEKIDDLRHEYPYNKAERLQQLHEVVEEIVDGLHQRIGHLPEQAQREAGERLQRALERIRRPKRMSREDEPRQNPPDLRRDRPEPGPPEARLHHLRIAAENLEAAGMHELVGHIVKQIERLERDGDRGWRSEGHPIDASEEIRDIPPHPEQMERALGEMHERMEQMHQEMDQMRQQLERLTDKLL